LASHRFNTKNTFSTPSVILYTVFFVHYNGWAALLFKTFYLIFIITLGLNLQFIVITQILYMVLLIIFPINEGDDNLKHMKVGVILGLTIMILVMAGLTAVTAHPGHGTPIEEPSNTEISETGTTTTDSDSTSLPSSSTTSTSANSRSGSTGSLSTNYNPTKDNAQSKEGTAETSTDNTISYSENTPEKFTDYVGSEGLSAAAPVAMMGLIVFIGLVAMAFPYQKSNHSVRVLRTIFGK
jgi:hypothetical protein